MFRRGVMENGQELQEHRFVHLALAAESRSRFSALALVLDYLGDAQHERVERQLRKL
jgi:hypothetical protein